MLATCYNASYYYNFKLQGYNGSDWEDITGDIIKVQGAYGSVQTYEVNIPSYEGEYSKYRLQGTTSNTSGGVVYIVNTTQLYIYTIQFYTKLDKTIIHSAPLDTIYYMDNGTPIVVCSTNSNGIGELDLSGLEDGTYTLYSSVAKDPSNLSNDYSKAIRITKTAYGETKEIYLIPDTLKTLYWFGYLNTSECEEISTANGWSGNSMSGTPPTYNTNSILMPQTSGGTVVSGIGTNQVITGTLKAIVRNVSGIGGQMGGLAAKTALAGPNPGVSPTSTSDQVITVTLSSKVAILWSFYTNSCIASAFWYE